MRSQKGSSMRWDSQFKVAIIGGGMVKRGVRAFSGSPLFEVEGVSLIKANQRSGKAKGNWQKRRNIGKKRGWGSVSNLFTAIRGNPGSNSGMEGVQSM